jgi:hypothetical protein
MNTTRTKTLLGTLLLGAITTLLPIQADAQEKENKQEATTLVFVPTENFHQKTKTMETNTLYWTGNKGEPEIKEKDGKTFLELRGWVTMKQAFSVPQGAHTATLDVEAEVEENPWAGINVSKTHMVISSRFISKEGQLSGRTILWKNEAKPWTEIKRTIKVPEGAKQLIVWARSSPALTIRIGWIGATFDKPGETTP